MGWKPKLQDAQEVVGFFEGSTASSFLRSESHPYMCTVSVHLTPTEVLATMNRDEANTRAPELPPRVHEAGGGVVWAAPHDGDAGGTWMGANNRGVVACLLNAYREGDDLSPDATGRFRSRGEIIPHLLEQGDAEAGVAWIGHGLDPELYPSFMLLVFSFSGGQCFTWFRSEGIAVRAFTEGWNVVSSSGWDSREVIGWREAEFARWRAQGCKMHGTAPTFNFLQVPGQEDRSPLMKRPWSATRSVTQVRASAITGEVQLRYWPQPAPGGSEPGTSLTLALDAPRKQGGP